MDTQPQSNASGGALDTADVPTLSNPTLQKTIDNAKENEQSTANIDKNKAQNHVSTAN